MKTQQFHEREIGGYRSKLKEIVIPRVSRSSADAEHQLLGCMLVIGRDAWETLDKAIGIASRATFHGELERIAFKIICEYVRDRREFDAYLLAPVIAANYGQEFGVADRIMLWLQSVYSAWHIHSYAEAVVSAYQEREAINAVNQFGLSVQSGGDVSEEQSRLNETLLKLAEASAKTDMESSSVKSLFAESLAAKEAGIQAGIPSGLMPFDDAIKGGAKSSQLIVVAARPSHGKTALGCQWALKAASNGKSAVFLTYEMERTQISDIWMQMADVRTDDEVSCGMFQELPLYCVDAAAWDISRIEAEMKAASGSGKLDMLVIDYLTLIPQHDKKLDQIRHLEDLTRRLKQLARTLKIPIVLLAQLNREIESRDDKTPRMRDLRGCGSIEQDADLIVALWRDTPSKLHIIKQRAGGALSTIDVTMHPSKGTFVECVAEPEFPTWDQ